MTALWSNLTPGGQVFVGILAAALVGLFIGALVHTWHRMQAEIPLILADPDPYDHEADDPMAEYRAHHEGRS